MAVKDRTVDKKLLTGVASGQMFCAIARRLLQHIESRVVEPLDRRIKGHYAEHIFEAYARLDVPTFDDPIARRRLESAWSERTSVAWDAVQSVSGTFFTLIQLVTEMSVLFRVLRGQKDGILFAVLSFIPPLLMWMRFQQFFHTAAGMHSSNVAGRSE